MATAQAHSADDLAQAVLRVLQPGNGRSNRCEVRDELPQRLAEDGVQYRVEDLPLALIRLEDASCIIRVQRQLHPLYIARKGLARFDDADRLAADVAQVLRAHGEEFENEDQLRSWLDQDSVVYDEHTLTMAVRQLEDASRLKRPRQDQWRDDVRCRGIGFRLGSSVNR